MKRRGNGESIGWERRLPSLRKFMPMLAVENPARRFKTENAYKAPTRIRYHRGQLVYRIKSPNTSRSKCFVAFL